MMGEVQTSGSKLFNNTGVKIFSEQGYKVWRARATGVTAKQAGDAHNPKAELVVEKSTSDNILPGV